MASEAEAVNLDPSKFSRMTRQELEDLCLNYATVISTHEARMIEVNELLLTNLKEIRQLKEINKKIVAENKHLQDLCCQLDIDRISGRKLAKEWQKFGKYSANVVKNEVPLFKARLKTLEELQNEVIDTVGNYLSLSEMSEKAPKDNSTQSTKLRGEDQNQLDSSVVTYEREQINTTGFRGIANVETYRSPRRRHPPRSSQVRSEESQLSEIGSARENIQTTETRLVYSRSTDMPSESQRHANREDQSNSEGQSKSSETQNSSLNIDDENPEELTENLSGRDSTSILSSVCLSTI